MKDFHNKNLIVFLVIHFTFDTQQILHFSGNRI